MDLVYWLLLLRAPHLGIRTFYKALKEFETPEGVLSVSANQRKLCGLFKTQTLDYLDQCSVSLVNPDLKWQEDENCHIITLIDKNYPQQLKTISDPPPILYIRGDMSCLSKPQIAIVGSRNPTPGGGQNAHKFASRLSVLGAVITSGMAGGIDAQAHIGALESGMQTIAVCGTGLDRVYPAKHKSLARQIASQGALVSEFSLGTAPIARNFPRRNRVISGLSLGTLVVEASIKSGTMVTAKLSVDQGREVFAIPGSINNPLSEGCHQLIKQGAKLVTGIEDIIQELPSHLQWDTNQPNKNVSTKDMDNNTSILLKYLSYDTTTIDQIVEKSGLSPQIVTQELLLLELNGKVAKTSGSSYTLI